MVLYEADCLLSNHGPFIGGLCKEAASKAFIARWLKEAIASAYILSDRVVPVGLRAHSTKMQAASCAECSSVLLMDICLAIWATLLTFEHQLDMQAQLDVLVL